MSQRVKQTIANFLCKGRPCPHHVEEASVLYELVVEAQKKDREEVAEAALDRLAAVRPSS